jgi:hypothetical protein
VALKETGKYDNDMNRIKDHPKLQRVQEVVGSKVFFAPYEYATKPGTVHFWIKGFARDEYELVERERDN